MKSFLSNIRHLLVVFVALLAMGHVHASDPAQSAKDDWEKARLNYASGRYDEAMTSFWIFAASGFIEASHVLGVIYEEGKAVPRSMTMAMRYFECAAQNGYPLSQVKMAYHLTRTPEVKRDQARAYFWAALAASSQTADQDLRQLAIKLRESAAKHVNQATHVRLENELVRWTPTKQECYFRP
jgi:TPR repeat protein